MASSTSAAWCCSRIFAASSGKRCASVATMRNSAAASGIAGAPGDGLGDGRQGILGASMPVEFGGGQHARHVAVDQPGDHRGQQIGLVLESLIDGAGRYAGLVRHLVDAGLAVSVAQKHPGSGRDEGIGATPASVPRRGRPTRCAPGARRSPYPGGIRRGNRLRICTSGHHRRKMTCVVFQCKNYLHDVIFIGKIYRTEWLVCK